MQNNNVTYFDSFGVEHIPKEIKAFINRHSSSALPNKNIKTKFSEYKHIIQQCMDIFVLVLLILCLKKKH